MAVEDHPKFDAWSKAFDWRNEAERRYNEAKMQRRPEGEIRAAKIDLDKAQAAYDLIADNLDTPPPSDAK